MDTEIKSKRGGWGSNFGFLMASIGSAVGLGNIWGFPYKMGKSGGAVFLLLYLVLVVLVGVTVVLGALALGLAQAVIIRQQSRFLDIKRLIQWCTVVFIQLMVQSIQILEMRWRSFS